MATSNTTLSTEFYVSFKAEHESLLARLDAPQPDIAALQLDAARLRRRLTDATEYLPAYDQRTYTNQLKSLEDDLVKRAPKQRFGFKRKEPASTATKPAPSTPQSAPSVVAAPAPPTHTPTSTGGTSVLTLRDLSNSVINASHFPTTSLTSPSELTISSLSDCLVDLRAGISLTSVHANGLRRVILLLPQIQGSILLDDCEQCELAVACHQFRMHKTTATDVYLHISSMPVIEHCTGIRFAAYPFEDLVRLSANSQHFSVQDFDWILPTPSPNWTRLEPTDQTLITRVALRLSGSD